MSLTNKVIVITGASSGIGEATAKVLADKGAKVVLGARREENLRRIAGEIASNGGTAVFQKTDVKDLKSVKALVQLAMERFGQVDALYNNAGIMPTALLNEAHHDEWQNMLEINIMGVLNGIEAVLPIMEKQGFGHILATDSVAGHQVYPGSAVYCGTKFAVRAIMDGLRQEEAKKGIKSTIVSPGAVNTELFKSINDQQAQADLLASWKQPNNSLAAEDLANAVAYAVDTPARASVSEIIIRPTAQEM